jgi:hypothetical protein
MHVRSAYYFGIAILFLACAAEHAQAQTIQFDVDDVALRNGESVEFGDVYLIGANCRSLLTATPEVEVMDGPPGVTVSIKQAMVVPRYHGCGKPVTGGKMLFFASNVEDYSYTRMVLRVTYKTRSGNVQRSQHVNVTLFP